VTEAFNLDEICSWAAEGGAIARRGFNHVAATLKPDRSLVTAVDVAIEQLLVQRIAARYPHHGIIGEEQSRRVGEGEYLWALDPLDGTAAFVAGLPLWCVSIGLLQRGVPVLGVVYVPLLDEYYTAAPADSARLNGHPIHARSLAETRSGDWLAVPSDVQHYTIAARAKLRSTGSTAASICYVARGSAIGAVVSRSAIWDLAGALAVLAAAGGAAAYLNGSALTTAELLDGRQTSGPTLYAHPERLTELHASITRSATAISG
jgi:myo-inositol-1(or 4)-monophosphatase